MEHYKLPKGIRIPRDDEYPNSYNMKEISTRRKNANIVQGYIFTDVQNEKFTSHFKINVDTDKFWELFTSLTERILPDLVYGIVGFKDTDGDLSNFTNKKNVVNLLKEYAYELTNDGYLFFGIAHYDNDSLNEVFASSFKQIIIWTTQAENVKTVLARVGLNEYDNLNFINEFPVVSEALVADANMGIRHYSQVLDEIKQAFKTFDTL